MKNEGFTPYFRSMDTLWQAWLSRFTFGISPAGASEAFHAWSRQLAQAPGKMAEIALYPALHAQDFMRRMACPVRGEDCKADPRFKSENWDYWPWRAYAEGFLFLENWVEQATTNVPGLDDDNARAIAFGAR